MVSVLDQSGESIVMRFEGVREDFLLTHAHTDQHPDEAI